MKYFQVIAVSLSLALGFASLAWGAVDAQDLEGLPLTLEEYHDAWISYLQDRLDYARQRGDERLENAMLWILEHVTKESIAERLEEEGGLAIRSVAENVIFEWEYEGGGTVRFWVGATEGKKVTKMGIQPRQKSDCEWSLSWSTENWSVSAKLPLWA